MRQSLLLLALVVLVIPSPATEHHSAKTPSSSTSKQGESEEIQPAQPPVIQQTTVNCEPTEKESSAERQAPAKPSHGFIESLNAWSTFVIAVFAVITAIAVFRQVTTTRDVERAWMVGSPNMPKLDIPESAVHLLYVCNLKNTGRTPARILQVGLAFRQAKSIADIPQTPSYGSNEISSVNRILLVPQDSFVNQTMSPVTNAEYIAAKNRERVLYAYGFVKYLDVFGKPHETCFCHCYYVPGTYELQIEGFRLCAEAPTAYNTAT